MTPSMRRQIEAGFGARVYESYGSHEFHLIAAECPETGLLHVNERTVLLEVLNGDGEVGSGQGGETVITALHSFTQPFIRFRLGDWVERGPAPCPCGLPWATLKRVEGRKVDWIKLPGGDSIPPERLCMALSMTMPWIKQYQIIQENRESLLVKVVPFEPPRQSEIEQLSRALSEFVKGELRCSFEFVDHIPLGPAGKFQLCRSACH